MRDEINPNLIPKEPILEAHKNTYHLHKCLIIYHVKIAVKFHSRV